MPSIGGGNLANKKNVHEYLPSDWVNGSCPICPGRDKRCSQTFDYAWAVCYRPDESALQFKTGSLGRYGIYPLDASRANVAAPAPKRPVVVELTEELENLLNSVYRALTDRWVLSDEHLQFCLKRGFTSQQIERQMYRTSSNSNSIIQELVAKFGPSLLKVPGFRQILGNYHFCSTGAFIIPTINHNGSVVNFRVRNIHAKHLKDRYFYVSSYDKQSNSGLKAFISAHTVVPKVCADTRVWITEGELKAHYASDRLSAICISIPGVNSWSRAIQALDHLGTKRVVLAFDDDMWSNPQVARCLVNLYEKLKGDDYEVTIAKW